MTQPKLILSPAPPPAKEPLFVYVAIRRTGPNQLHAGMFYFHPKDKRWEVLHHPWHQCPLGRDTTWKRYSWVENDWDPDIARNIRARCLAVSQTNPSLNYSLVYDANTHFNENGVLVQTNAVQGRPGLTCSTFVLAILKGVGVSILNEGNWPPNPSDQQWANQMLELLGQKDPTYAEAMKEKLDAWARFSPQDVAAASGLPSPPPNRDTVTPHGDNIAKQL